MGHFFETWADAALTSLGFFWMALWAFCLGYLISAMIQVFVTRRRMQRAMGDAGARAVGLGAFFGFISSSCSFAALSTTRALFQKGAGLAPALAYLLASTNLVIELGILILVFLSWHFVVGEYVGGILLVLITWLLVTVLVPERVIEAARDHARSLAGGPTDHGGDDHDHDHDHGCEHEHDSNEAPPPWRRLIQSREGWRRVARRFTMEWSMVWKDVLFGFTVAGVIAAFVPPEFFRTLFVGSGSADLAWWQIVLHTLIGPLAAFFTFIGSMGNIPLAAVLFGSGVSFAGVMAFIFSDLVVFPVLRITGRYFGWRMAGVILAIFLASLVITAITLHAGFAAFDLLPDPAAAETRQTSPTARFNADHTLLLNLVFLAAASAMLWLRAHPGDDDHGGDDHGHDHDHGSDRSSWMQRTLTALASISMVWLVIGVGLHAYRVATG